MRIIISFLSGLLFFFYFSQIIIQLKSKFKILDYIFSINYSLLGFIFLFFGIWGEINFYFSTTYSLVFYFIIGSGLGLLIHHLLAKQYILFKNFEQNFVKSHQGWVDRMFEILPGALLWLTLTSPLWLSYLLPFAVAYLILLADTYWLISAIKIAFLIYIGYRRMEKAKSVDWLNKLQEEFPKKWDNYYHLLVIPTYTESLEVLAPAFDAIVNSTYPKDKIFLAVGFEEREKLRNPEKIKETTDYLNKLSQKIGGVFTTIHPFELPGEVPGPGTNRNWMINNAVSEFKKRKIPQDKVFVTTLDADFVVHPQFLAGAIHKYLTTPEKDRDKRTYTGVFLYFNNYWQAPTPMRLIAVGTSLWQLAEMVGSDKYMNFSSLSINLKSLLEIGLWMPDKVNDDSGFYWKAYYHFKGDYKVIPHFLPISADAVLDVNLLKTFQNQYGQQKRWAYGVEHIPYIVKQYFANKDVNFWDKTDKMIFAIWGYLKWGTLALFVTFAGLLIPFVNPNYSQSVVSYNLPVVSSWVLTAAFFGLFATIYVNEKTAPPRPKNWGGVHIIWSYVQWALVPILLVTISTLPVIDAQTTLMLGKHLEFRITRKARVSKLSS